MGFMTEVSILNDRWDEIRKNSREFVEQIYESSMTNGRCPSYLIGQTTVAKTHHADDIRGYFSGRNSFFDAYPDKDMGCDGLRYQLDYIAEMQRCLKVAKKATEEALAKGVKDEAK